MLLKVTNIYYELYTYKYKLYYTIFVAPVRRVVCGCHASVGSWAAYRLRRWRRWSAAGESRLAEAGSGRLATGKYGCNGTPSTRQGDTPSAETKSAVSAERTISGARAAPTSSAALVCSAALVSSAASTDSDAFQFPQLASRRRWRVRWLLSCLERLRWRK